jgi:hypothetical protein
VTAGPDQPPREAGTPEDAPTSVGWPGLPAHPAGPPVRPTERGGDGAPRQPEVRPDPSPAADEPTAVGGRGPAQSSAPPPRPTTTAGPPVAPPRPAARHVPAPAAMTRPMSVGPTATAATRKGGRRARLTVKRIDPWSTLKFSFVYSLAGLVVLIVAVIALYSIVDAMGVIESIRSFLRDVGGNSTVEWLSFGRVLSIALLVGAVNVILFTAFATLTAFVYNVCTDLVGGIEVTLAEHS